MARVLFLVCLMVAVGTAAVRAEDHNVLVNTRYCRAQDCSSGCEHENKREATGNCEPAREQGHVKSYKATCNSTHYSYTTYLDEACNTVDSTYKDVELGCERVVIPANLKLTDGGNYTLDLCTRLHRPTEVKCDGCSTKPFAELAPSAECKDTTFGYLGDVSYKTDDGTNTLTLHRGKSCTGQQLFSEVAKKDAVKCVALEDVKASSKCILANTTSAVSAIPVVGAALGLLLSSLLL